jgi:hypothetical protein
MMSKTIHYEIVDQVGVFTIDNGKQNVMSTAMYEPFTVIYALFWKMTR